jgi:hypothetical protein
MRLVPTVGVTRARSPRLPAERVAAAIPADGAGVAVTAARWRRDAIGLVAELAGWTAAHPPVGALDAVRAIERIAFPTDAFAGGVLAEEVVRTGRIESLLQVRAAGRVVLEVVAAVARDVV